MKVFISSLINGQEEYRNAADEAIAVLGHRAIRAEQFPASAATPQQACLAGVREADVVILILGAQYGATQGSGLSATHEEYREARERKPVLVFIEAGMEADPAQRAFMEEVEGWATGHFRGSFQTVEQLKAAVIRGLHEHELALSAGAVDENEMLQRTRALVPARRGMGTGSELVVAIAGGPHQQVLRPAEVEDPALARDLQREALFGEHSLLDASEGTAVSVRGDALVLEQPSASVLVDQAGSVRILRSLMIGDRQRGHLPAIIEEDVIESVVESLRFAGWLFDRVDPMRRLTEVLVVAGLLGSGYMAWRTRAEHERSPNTGSVGGGRDDVTVTLTPLRRHRQALTYDADRLGEDLAVLLRRART